MISKNLGLGHLTAFKKGREKLIVMDDKAAYFKIHKHGKPVDIEIVKAKDSTEAKVFYTQQSICRYDTLGILAELGKGKMPMQIIVELMVAENVDQTEAETRVQEVIDYVNEQLKPEIAKASIFAMIMKVADPTTAPAYSRNLQAAANLMYKLANLDKEIPVPPMVEYEFNYSNLKSIEEMIETEAAERVKQILKERGLDGN